MGAAPKLDSEYILKKLDDIPSLPAVVYELSNVISDPMSSTKHVEEIMSQDIGLTTKVLKLANSAYYAIPGGVTSLARAIAYIGFDAVHQLVLGASIINALEVKGKQPFDLGEFWKHSIGVAIAGETIAKHVKHPTPSDLFTCGLIHDLGKIALFLTSPETLIYVIEDVKARGVSYHEAESPLEIPSHNEIGRMLAEKWSLPRSIQAVTKHHHEKDMNKRANLSQDINQFIDIVTLANLFMHALKFGNSGHQKAMGVPADLMGRLMIDPKTEIIPLLKEVKVNLEKASEFIKMIAAK
jgi:HD-like signal output (HDOD) protein